MKPIGNGPLVLIAAVLLILLVTAWEAAGNGH